MSRDCLGTNLLLSRLARVLNTVPTLNDIGFQANGPWSAMEFEKKPTSIA